MSLKKRIVFILPIAALLLAGFGCGKKPAPAPAPAPATPSSAANEPAEDPGTALDMRIAGNAIIAMEQKPRNFVRFAVVATDKAAFIVVRENDRLTGPLLGTSALLTVGESTDVNVELSRMSKDGETLYAAIYADNGDDQYGPEDAALLDFEGNAMYAEVMISATAEEGGAPVL